MDRDAQSLADVRAAARALIAFTAGFDRDRFEADQTTRYAVLYAIVVQGEAVKRLSVSFRDQHPEIPWSRICGMRDRVVHAYDRVDLDIVWSVVTTHAPQLLASLDTIIPPESNV